jgi:hypothetical protein
VARHRRDEVVRVLVADYIIAAKLSEDHPTAWRRTPLLIRFAAQEGSYYFNRGKFNSMNSRTLVTLRTSGD